MGWRDRDWARFDERERRVLYEPAGGASGPARRWSTGRPTGSVVLAAGVALALFLAGHFPKSHPIIPALNFGLPGTSPHGHIATSAAEFGSTFTLSGTTPERREGTVLVEGSWNDAPWLPLASATTTGGTYVARFQITDHGTLKLKAKYPGGGEADGTVLVP